MNLKSVLKFLGNMLPDQKLLNEFSKSLRDFGDSMQIMNEEFTDDIEKSRRTREERGTRDRDNIDKLLGKKKSLF